MGLIECKECKKAMDAIDKRNMRLDKKESPSIEYVKAREHSFPLPDKVDVSFTTEMSDDEILFASPK